MLTYEGLFSLSDRTNLGFQLSKTTKWKKDITFAIALYVP